MTHVLDAEGRIKTYPGAIALDTLADYARGSVITGAAAWSAYDAKTDGAVLVGDGTDILSTINPTIAGTVTAADFFLPDGGTIGIDGNELLTFNAAGTAVFSGVGSVQVPDGAWVGADAACSWVFDSTNGDVTTLDKVGVGTTVPAVGDVNVDVEIADSSSIAALSINCYDDGAAESRLYFRKSDTDTIGTLAQTDDGDWLGFQVWQGVNSSLAWGEGAYILAIQRGAAGAVYVETDLFLTTYSNTGNNANQLVLDGGTGNVGINVAEPLAKCHIDQATNNAAIPVLALDQADVSEGFINFIGTAAESAVGPISTFTGGNAVLGFVRAEINGVQRWLAFYGDPTE